jgi:CIC family chloride channel protein
MGLLNKYLRVPRLRTRESFLSYLKKWILLSTVLGLLTGVVVALFDYVTNLTLWSYSSSLFAQNPLMIAPFLLVALSISGLLLRHSSTPTGSGTEEIIDAYNNPEYTLDERSFPQKMLAAVITIGLGVSAGQEGPSVCAGGVVGSWVWRKLGRLGLADDDKRTLILAGAAAGIGAIFKAPLTRTIFALAVPFKDDLAHDALIPSLVSAVASYLTLIAPLFNLHGILSLTLTDIVTSAVLGLLIGVAALRFIAVSRFTAKVLGRFGSCFLYNALIGTCVLSMIGLYVQQRFESNPNCRPIEAQMGHRGSLQERHNPCPRKGETGTLTVLRRLERFGDWIARCHNP